MILEGVVTNVTNFGAFVDIGVHQDGLVHISALSEKFIKDPREAVKAGDVVKVKVMEVDIARKRVGLSMRMSDTPGEKVDGARGARPGAAPRQQNAPARAKETPAPANNAMASLFANAKQLKKR
ncbi:30S ribosomal protein S1 [compost metagenome]